MAVVKENGTSKGLLKSIDLDKNIHDAVDIKKMTIADRESNEDSFTLKELSLRYPAPK